MIFTLIIQSIVALEYFALVKWGQFWSQARWDGFSQIAAPALTAFVIGMVFSAGANNDLFHALARRLGISGETSFPSEWFGAFATNVSFVVLTLSDERRLYGWPIDWPSDPNEGHFVLQQISWLTDEGEREVTGVSQMVVKARDVKWVEFLDKTWENNP